LENREFPKLSSAAAIELHRLTACKMKTDIHMIGTLIQWYLKLMVSRLNEQKVQIVFTFSLLHMFLIRYSREHLGTLSPCSICFSILCFMG